MRILRMNRALLLKLSATFSTELIAGGILGSALDAVDYALL